MSGYAVAAIVVVVTLLAVLAIVVAVPLANRLFAFLGSIVDAWRPTPAGQARPGHDCFGVGVLFLAAPVAAFFWYDIGPALAGLRNFPLSAILSLIVVMIIVPLVGLMSLVHWRNSRIEFDGASARIITVFGTPRDWSKVVEATMQPPMRSAGRIRFETADGFIGADTGWINIRAMYEQLGRSGVKIEPWRERAEWKDLWS